jgi:hypothetical protein
MNSILLYSLILGSDAVLVIYVDTYILGIVIVNEVLEVSPWTSIATETKVENFPSLGWVTICTLSTCPISMSVVSLHVPV